MNSENPFAPPLAELSHQNSQFLPHKVFRRGDSLFILNGAALPERCFATGVETKESYPIRLVCRPDHSGSWGKKLTVQLEVPLAAQVIRSHLRMVNIGLSGLAICGVIAVFSIAIRSMDGFGDIALFGILLACVITWVPFLNLASRSPYRPNILSADNQQIQLGDIHPDCLAAVPEVESELS